MGYAEEQEYRRMLEALTEKPGMLGLVLSVQGKRCFVRVGSGTRYCVNEIKAKPGDTVMVDDQVGNPVMIVERPAFGATLMVDQVTAGGFEVQMPDGGRVILAGNVKAKVGDRIVVDESGSVALANIGRPKTLQTYAKNPGIAWDDIGGLEEAKAALRAAIELPLKHKTLFSKYRKKPARGVLLYGPPGCGKTLLAKATATSFSVQHGKKADGGFIHVKGPELLNMYVGQTEASIRAIFSQAREYHQKNGAPAVIFLDEAESILGERTGRSNNLSSTIVPMFLSEMDGLEETGAFVILASNLPGALDSAVTRDRRLDRRIEVGRPNYTCARDIFGIHLRDKPLVSDESSTELADAGATEVFDDRMVVAKKSAVELMLRDLVSGAMIEGIVERATSSAISRELEGGRPGLSSKDIIQAVAEGATELSATNLSADFARKAGQLQQVRGVA